ncbi:MAG: hypothetical protein JSW17_02555 [Candidatus Omnitrophota bacterium]|nr:MAG: hypothetical protein JSW17_02555 [Candidatus Omnitrophota bacterium]
MKDNKILNYFSLLKGKNLLGSSYLFIGDDFSLVKDIVKLINCNEKVPFCNSCWDCKKINEDIHPDVCLVKPDPITISIASIREAQHALALRSYRLPKKVVIIKEAEALGIEAANAFLKTLEEPPKNSFIAVCASKLEALLPTVISRCRKIFLPFKEGSAKAVGLDKISSFLNGERLKFKDRKQFASFLWTLVLILRDELVSESGLDNQLLERADYERIFEQYPALKEKEVEELITAAQNILKIYGAYQNVNQNLALDMIRTKLG